MTKQVKLYDTDYVVLYGNSKDDLSFLRFTDGQIFITADLSESQEESEKQSESFEVVIVSDCTKLNKEQVKELKDNIRYFEMGE